METTQWTLTKILNRATVEAKPKSFNYNKMDCINSSPDLQAGNENLQEYTLSLSLHYSFCNPQKIIEIIQAAASSREPFDWIYNKMYKGVFVIDEINIPLTKQIDNLITYAELSLNLLEFPTDSEYLDQLDSEVNLEEFEQYDINSNRMSQFLSSAKTTIQNNIEAALSGETLISDNLSDAAKEIFENTRLDVLSNVQNGNYINIYNITKNAINNLSKNNLNLSDIQNLKSAIEQLPNLVLDASIRSSI